MDAVAAVVAGVSYSKPRGVPSLHWVQSRSMVAERVCSAGCLASLGQVAKGTGGATEANWTKLPRLRGELRC